MPIDAEDLARAALVRLIPRRRYRIAARGDARFASFAAETTRIAFRQQGGKPSLLLFCGPGQDARRAALAAAEWASANWRPNAIQRTIRPGVVAVQVGPVGQLGPAGPLADAAVPAVTWTVEAESGRAETPGGVPGAPPAGEIRRAAAALARGVPAPSLGEIDYAERELMHGRGGQMPPMLTGVAAILVVLFALRYGFQLLAGAVGWFRLAQRGGQIGLIGLAFAASNLLLLAGVVLGAALLLNLGGFAYRAPGFSSSSATVRRASWAGYVLVMLALVGVLEYVLPQALRGAVGAGRG